MYIGSPRHTRKNRFKDEEAAKKAGFPYKAALFDAIFAGGLSTMREEKSTNEEVKLQAEKIAEGLRKDKAEGGFFSVLQFCAGVIFAAKDAEGGTRQFCLYDTPINPGVKGSEVLSHADVFPAGPAGSEAKALRTVRRVQIQKAVAANYQELEVKDYRDNILGPWEASPSLTTST
ncbi:MAG: hypothetical protein AB3N24_18095 [Leisingera sp.]